MKQLILLLFACTWLWYPDFVSWGAEGPAAPRSGSRPEIRVPAQQHPTGGNTTDGGKQAVPVPRAAPLETPLAAPFGCVAIDADRLPVPLFNVSRLWGQKGKFWPQGSTLRVKLMNGTRTQQERAWSRFKEIDALVNLSFVRVAAGESEIRVGFTERGHWSYLGRDCLGISQRKPTMNLQLSSFDSQAEWDRVARHEILHAIGFDHEQSHPSQSIPWNKAAVYEDYRRTQGWSRAQVDRQVLNRYSGTEFMGSEYDRDSIMQYPIDRRHVTDPRFAVGWNSRLSLQDLATLNRVYPP